MDLHLKFSDGIIHVHSGSTAGPSITTTKALTDSPATTSASATAASAASPSQESKTQEPEGAEGPSEESAFVVEEEDAAVEMDSSE